MLARFLPLACLFAAGDIATAIADERASVPSLRTIVVPDALLPQTLGENSVPIRLGTLNDLLAGTANRPDRPAQQRIDVAEYEATFLESADALVGGTLRATATNTAAGPELLSLEPLKLAVSELTVHGQPAAWGISTGGELLLHIAPGQQSLEGEWSLQGRRIHNSVVFDVRVMPAGISRLRLKIPAEYELRSSTGTVRAPAAGGNDGIWNVELGSEPQCRLELRRREEIQALSPQVTYTLNSLAVASQTGVQLTFDASLDVHRAGLEEFAIVVPLRVDVQSISYATRDGRDVPLLWTEEADESHRYFLVRLPGKLIESSRRIRVLATAPLPLSEMAVVPKLNIRNATFLSGDLNLKIEKPLQLRNAEMRGYRQTIPLRMTSDGEQFAFRRFRPDGELEVDIGLPQLAMSARVLSRVEGSQRGWEMESSVQWTARSGSTFWTSCRIPSDWDITDVQPAAGSTSSKLSSWRVELSDDETRELVCEFQESLAADSPKSVQVSARLLVAAGAESIVFPVLIPLACQDSDAIVAITVPAGETAAVDPSSEFREIDAVTVQEILGNEIPASLVAGDPEIYYASQFLEHDILRLQRSQQHFELAARTLLEVDPGGLHQLYTLDVQPLEEPVDRVVVFLTEAGTAPLWQMIRPDEPPQGLTSIALNRHEDWDLPLQGELWEVRLPSATDRPFRLSAVRTIPSASSYRPGLVFAPNVAKFSAAVAFGGVERDPAEVATSHLVQTEVSAELLGFANLDPEAPVWQYDRAAAALEITLSDRAYMLDIPAFATCELRTLVTPPGQEFDRHWAEYSLDAISIAQGFRFRLPERAELLESHTDSGSVETTRTNDGYALAFEKGSEPTRVTISYRVPSSQGVFRQPITVPLPSVEVRVLEFRWLCGVPPGVRIGALPAHLRSQEAIPSVSWYERFLGPIGRAGGESMFNPFVAGAWRELLQPAGSGANRGGKEDFPPAGWMLLEAIGSEPPESWVVTAWNEVPIRALAWAVFLGILALGCLLRGIRMSFRSELGIVCVACALVAAWFAPTAFAEVTGGFLGGIVVAMLVPRRLIDRPGHRRVSSHPGSTIALRTSVGAVAFVIAAAWAHAQDGLAPGAKPLPGTPTEAPTLPTGAGRVETRSGEPEASIADIQVVVIPSSSRDDGENGVAYIDEEFLRQLQSLQPQTRPRPDYLLSSAVYRSTVTATGEHRILATFEVVVLSDSPVVRTEFPLAGMVLGGSSPCTIDGVPGAIVRTAGATGFSVDLPKADSSAQEPVEEGAFQTARHRVELALLPLTVGDTEPAAVAVSVPPLASNRWELQFADGPSTHTIRGGLGVVHGAEGKLVAELGRADQVTIGTAAQPSPADRGHVQSRLQVLLEAAPGRCGVHLESSYEVTEGTVDFLVWDFGPQAVLHRLLDEKGANVPFYWSANGNMKIVVPLDPPRTAGARFTLSADLTLPSSDGDGTISLPAFMGVGEPQASGPTVEVAESQIGITASNGFQLELPSPFPAPFEVLSPDDFVLPATRSDSPRKPQVVLRSAAPATLQFGLTPVLAEQQLQYFSQEGRIRKNRLEWTVQAEVETSAAGTFEHRLRLDPRLRIESVSVQADEAERSARWSRFDDRLVVHLSQKTSATQEVIIKSSMPLALDEPTRLPEVRFEGVTPIASDLRLYRDTHSRFELVEHAELTPMDSGATPAPEGNGETLLGRYRLPRDSAVLHVRPYVEEEPPLSSTVTLVEAHPGDLWSIRTLVRFERKGKRMLPCRLYLPPKIATNYDLTPSDAIGDVEPDRTADTEDGSLVLLLHPRMPTVESMTAVVSAGPFPADAPQWTVPVVSTRKAEVGRTYLVVMPHGHWRPSGSEVAMLSASALPDWAAEHSLIRNLRTSAMAQTDVFRQTGGEWVLELADKERLHSHPRILHLETRIEVDDAGHLKGRTMLLAGLPMDTPLLLDWPGGTKLDAMFLDGRLVATPQPQGDALEVPAEAVAVVRRITLIWNRQEVGSPMLAGRIAATFPMPRNVAIDRALLEFVPAARLECARTTGIRPVDELDFLVHRYRGLLDFQQRAIEVTGTVEPVCWEILAELHSLLRNRLASPQEQATPETDRLRAEIQERAAQYRAIYEAAATSSVPRDATAEAKMIKAELLAPELGSKQHTIRGIAQRETPTNIVSFLVFDRRAAVFVLAVFAVGLTIPLLRRIMTPHVGTWLSIHDSIAWALLGLLWWTCLSPSFVGMLLLIPAAVHAFRRRRYRPQDSTALYGA